MSGVRSTGPVYRGAPFDVRRAADPPPMDEAEAARIADAAPGVVRDPRAVAVAGFEALFRPAPLPSTEVPGAVDLDLVLAFDFRILGWNEFWEGMHPGERARRARAWHEAAQFELAALYREEPDLAHYALRSADVYVRAFCRGQVLDGDNVCAKPLLDGLKRWHYQRVAPPPPKPGQKAKKYGLSRLERGRWLFEDDSRAYLRRITTEALPCDRDWIEVTIRGEGYRKPPIQRQLINYPRGSR